MQIELEKELSIKILITHSLYMNLKKQFENELHKLVSICTNDDRSRFKLIPDDNFNNYKPFDKINSNNNVIFRSLCTKKKVQYQWKQQYEKKIVHNVFTNKLLLIPLVYTEALERSATITEIINFSYRCSKSISPTTTTYQYYDETIRFYKFHGINNDLRESVEMIKNSNGTIEYYYCIEMEFSNDNKNTIDINPNEYYDQLFIKTTTSFEEYRNQYINAIKLFCMKNLEIVLDDHIDMKLSFDELNLEYFHNFCINRPFVSSNDWWEDLNDSYAGEIMISKKLDGIKCTAVYYNEILYIVNNYMVSSRPFLLPTKSCLVLTLEKMYDERIYITDIIGCLLLDHQKQRFSTKTTPCVIMCKESTHRALQRPNEDIVETLSEYECISTNTSKTSFIIAQDSELSFDIVKRLSDCVIFSPVNIIDAIVFMNVLSTNNIDIENTLINNIECVGLYNIFNYMKINNNDSINETSLQTDGYLIFTLDKIYKIKPFETIELAFHTWTLFRHIHLILNETMVTTAKIIERKKFIKLLDIFPQQHDFDIFPYFRSGDDCTMASIDINIDRSTVPKLKELLLSSSMSSQFPYMKLNPIFEFKIIGNKLEYIRSRPDKCLADSVQKIKNLQTIDNSKYF